MYFKHRWPDGVRCVAAMTVDLDVPSWETGRGFGTLGIHSSGRYSGRRGIPRILDLFDQHQIPATFFVPGFDAEQYPEVVRVIQRRGHEVAAHGYQHEDHGKLGDRERELLEKAHRSLERIAGNPPVGWRAPAGLLSPATLGHLAELGYLYDSSYQDDDFPYVMDVGGRRLVELPKFGMLDDATLYRSVSPRLGC